MAIIKEIKNLVNNGFWMNWNKRKMLLDLALSRVFSLSILLFISRAFEIQIVSRALSSVVSRPSPEPNSVVIYCRCRSFTVPSITWCHLKHFEWYRLDEFPHQISITESRYTRNAMFNWRVIISNRASKVEKLFMWKWERELCPAKRQGKKPTVLYDILIT